MCETNRVFESNTRIPCIIVIVPGSTLSHTEYISVDNHIHTLHKRFINSLLQSITWSTSLIQATWAKRQKEKSSAAVAMASGLHSLQVFHHRQLERSDEALSHTIRRS